MQAELWEDPVKIKSMLLTALLATPIVASAESPPPDTPAKTAPAKSARLSNDEVMIVAHLHHVNLMEIDMGKQAKLKGTAAVKRYGEMLVKDHSSSDKDVKALAKKKGLAKIPPAKPQTEAEKEEMKKMHEEMAALKKLKGADFDRKYLQMMVDGHEKELAKSDVFLASAQDPDLKTMLEARKTTLRRHADSAKELQQGNAQASVTPQPGPKSAK